MIFSHPPKIKFSQILRAIFVCAGILCATGAWGAARTQDISGTPTEITAYDSTNPEQEWILNLTADTTVTTLTIGPNVTINLNGYTLTVVTLKIGSDGTPSYDGNLTVTGDDTKTTDSFSVTNIEFASGQTTSITISSDVAVSDNLSSYTDSSDVTVTDFNTYYWTGNDTTDATLWTASANWAFKDSTREKYVSVAEYVDSAGNSYNGKYPGFENGDVAVFDSDSEIDGIPCLHYGDSGAQQAHDLFFRFRELDALGAELVYVRMPRQTGADLSVYNRLMRAAGFEVIRL